MRTLLCLCLATAPLGLTACATTSTSRSTTTYGDRAHRAYDNAMELLNAGGDLTEAGDAFRRVRRDFGLSRWAWLAELRLADIEFRQEHYSAAITAYRNWIRYHPTQPEVHYARFMIARSYYSEIPDEWALVPASWERDQSSTHDAEDALVRFLEEHPESEHAAEGRRLLERTRQLLARAEINIAAYYHSRNRSEAAIRRLVYVLETYGGSGVEPEALVRIGEIYLQLGRREEARGAFQVVVERFQRSSYLESARRYLRFIGTGPVRPLVITPHTPDRGAEPAPEESSGSGSSGGSGSGGASSGGPS